MGTDSEGPWIEPDSLEEAMRDRELEAAVPPEKCYTCGRDVGAEHSEGCPRRHWGATVTLGQARWTWDPASEPEPEPLPEQVHIAGPDMSVDGVMRQRCVWCGALILEYDLKNVAVQVEPGEEARPPAMFKPGVHVLVAGTWPVMHVAVEPQQHPADGEGAGSFVIPENSCMALDPDVTR